MTDLSDLIEKTVKYKCPKMGFTRYGVLKEVGARTKAPPEIFLDAGKKTVKAVIIKDWNNGLRYVPEANLLAWMHYKVERALDWRPPQTVQEEKELSEALGALSEQGM